ncbi:DNA ligase 3 isoform X2 [Aplysia californica]|uniref:DNA ligase n=1 Tax=Aplysia californica TaxID=6500 RepID=A0ABM1W1D1_APLCA|nr:DNA ligase 3 isoform X2 [Aplysia californica]
MLCTSPVVVRRLHGSSFVSCVKVICSNSFVSKCQEKRFGVVETSSFQKYLSRYSCHDALCAKKLNGPTDFLAKRKLLSLSVPYSSHSISYSNIIIMADNKYVVGYAKLGTSSCKKCKQKIEKGALRIGKVTPNPFSEDGGDMKQWFHPACIFETFVRARATTKKIEDPEDAEGFGDLKPEDKDVIKKLIDEYLSKTGNKPSPKPKKAVQATLPGASPAKADAPSSSSDSAPSSSRTPSKPSTSSAADGEDPNAEKDNSFRQFRRLCADIAEENSYLGKTKLVKSYITKGHSGVYNLNSKQLVKLFSQILATNLSRMIEDLDQGDVAETIRIFFEESKVFVPQKKSTLSLTEVDQYLSDLAQVTKEDDQQKVLTKITKRCTANDLKMVVRLIKHDLRINAGAKHILDGLDENAYAAFQASRDLGDVVDRVLEQQTGSGDKPGLKKKLSVRAALMTPVLPMLAEACRSVEQAMKKCPNGFYAEIKYDGERVQIHKKGNDFRYFSRSLKPVLDHKVKHFKEYIPKAFPTGSNLILDAEVLLVDTNTGNPLPFGTLGVHKKAAFQDAQVCLYIFDCLLINDENLMDRSIKERRKILEKNMSVVKNRVNLSEIKRITKPGDLQDLMSRVFKEGLEGLVLKDVNSIYEPGKRHWMKVKKDYLHQGSMADSADLVVLGAYFGTGNKGGIMSIFLMGVYDPDAGRWVTVSKCGSGLDDKMLETLNKELDMVKISKDFSKVPKWLHINKPLTPDFVVADPKKSPVWEIIGAEFSKAEIHTANGISIRFPRVQKIRDDKTWKEATDLPRLKKLFAESKEKADSDLMRAMGKGGDDDNDDGGSETEDDGDNSGEENGRNGDATGATRISTPGKKGEKRRASDDVSEESSPPKKQANPMGKYGASCHQKRGKHTEEFRHPESSSADTASSGGSSSQTAGSASGLPAVFHGCKIVLPSSVERFRDLKRYILAFDGDLLHQFEASSATHIVVAPGSEPPSVSSKVPRVSPRWLWSCIRRRQLVDTAPYKT